MRVKLPKTSLDQWALLAAVVDAGGFAQAAAAAHRSQSAVSYHVARLQELLGVELLRIEGRRARLTPSGAVLLARARSLLEDLHALEQAAQSLRKGWESEIALVVDAAYPRPALFALLARLERECRRTQVRLADAVLSGAEQAILEGSADVVITTRVPSGALGDWVMDVEFVGVAAVEHPLHRLGRPLGERDLARHTQVVVRDSGSVKPRDEGWLGATHRWTVGGLEASLAIILSGLAYGWLPRHVAEPHLAGGRLATLDLVAGATRRLPLYVVQVKGEAAGPAAQRAAQLFRESRISGALTER